MKAIIDSSSRVSQCSNAVPLTAISTIGSFTASTQFSNKTQRQFQLEQRKQRNTRQALTRFPLHVGDAKGCRLRQCCRHVRSMSILEDACFREGILSRDKAVRVCLCPCVAYSGSYSYARICLFSRTIPTFPGSTESILVQLCNARDFIL